ncbi:MAG: D-2-hydroxyacid dehydrogenase [Christensenellales bacterium]
MEQLNILLIFSFDFKAEEEHIQQIRDVAPHAVIKTAIMREDTLEMAQEAEIIFGWPRRKFLCEAKKLRWLHLASAGAETYADRSLFAHQDVIVTNSSGVFGKPIAEHVIAMILAFNKNLYHHFKNRDTKTWDRVMNRRDFFNSTVGVLGLGDLGAEVAIRAKALGARVLAVKRTPSVMPAYVDALYGGDGIDEVLALSDYVVIALPNTPKTKGLIGAEKLKKMKPDSFLVNVARGDIVDQEALVTALNEHWIAGTGLDVTTPEPLPPESPLWDMDNVIITPHSSGFSPTNIDRRMDMFLDNLKRYLAGEPLTNLVDMEEGY